MKVNKIAIEIICLLFILLFVYAAVSKLLDVERFEGQIVQSPLLEPIASLVVWAIPVVEIMIAVLLIFPAGRLVGLMGSFVLMILFTGYIVAILQFSEHIPCSCGGILEHMGWTGHLIFNLLFTALAILGIFLTNTKMKTSLN